MGTFFVKINVSTFFCTQNRLALTAISPDIRQCYGSTLKLLQSYCNTSCTKKLLSIQSCTELEIQAENKLLLHAFSREILDKRVHGSKDSALHSILLPWKCPRIEDVIRSCAMIRPQASIAVRYLLSDLTVP